MEKTNKHVKRTGWKDEKMVIGILPSGVDVGATTLAILFGNYFASAEGYKTAIMDLREKGYVANMYTRDIFEFHGFMGFVMTRIHFFPEGSEELMESLLESDYQVIILILDYADASDKRMLLRCNYRYYIGSLAPWRYLEYEKLFSWLIKERIGLSNGDSIGIYLTAKTKERFQQEFGVGIRPLPHIEDPFCLKLKDLESIRELLPIEALEYKKRRSIRALLSE